MTLKTIYIRYRFHFILTFVLLIGAILIQSLLLNYYTSQKKVQQDELLKTHKETVLRIETGINVYATVVSSLKSHIQNSNEFPKAEQIQGYLYDLINEIDFKDSIVVSFVDTNQIFKYSVTPYQIDPFHLKGIDVSKIRPKAEVDKLNQLMYQNHISLFAPINLREGWAAFPFNFSARNSKNEVLGYIAPVLNVKYLLDYSYKNERKSEFAHSFIIEDSFALSREKVYDGTKSYNLNTDIEFFENFKIDDEKFVRSKITFYGLSITIGTAYKSIPEISKSVFYIAFLWYGIICIFSFIILNQMLKNKILNKKMRRANIKILDKNKALAQNFENIQTLLKEIHHRVKNNMQIISSLLNLQRNSQEDKEVIKALDTSKARIQSMALVHQKLYGSTNLTNINVNDYVTQLVMYIENAIEDVKTIPLKTILIDKTIVLNMDTMVPLGLILNELITNSYKYAFNENSNPKINITIVKINQNYQLIYADNGVGIPEKTNILDSGTLGLELIHILSEQLKGEVSYTKNELSTFTINFSQL